MPPVDHGADEQESYSSGVARAGFDYGGDEEVFGARIERGLHDENVAAHAFGGGVGESGFAESSGSLPMRRGFIGMSASSTTIHAASNWRMSSSTACTQLSG